MCDYSAERLHNDSHKSIESTDDKKLQAICHKYESSLLETILHFLKYILMNIIFFVFYIIFFHQLCIKVSFVQKYVKIKYE